MTRQEFIKQNKSKLSALTFFGTLNSFLFGLVTYLLLQYFAVAEMVPSLVIAIVLTIILWVVPGAVFGKWALEWNYKRALKK